MCTGGDVKLCAYWVVCVVGDKQLMWIVMCSLCAFDGGVQ